MIGILTFIGSQSHGACLQAYALKRMISDLGYDTEIINYISPEMKKTMESRLITTNKGLKKFLGSLKRYPVIKKRYNLFEDFEKEYLDVFTHGDTIDHNKYDMIIVGSDQVWNLDITGNDLSYMLEKDGKYIKASYAASMGVQTFPNEYERKCIELLSAFSYLNVREKQLKDYLEPLLPQKDIQVTVDPTLLLDKKIWLEMASKCPAPAEKYILVHYPFDSEENWKKIKEISTQKNAEIIFITNKVQKRSDCKCLNAVSPIEYISLINNADTVVTGSFHTLSFSLIFNKEFYCTQSMIANRNARLSNLLHISGCESQMLENYPHDISYSKVNSLLDEQRKRSLSILSEMCSHTNEDHKEEDK